MTPTNIFNRTDQRFRRALVFGLVLTAPLILAAQTVSTNASSFPKWSKIEISFTGPDSLGRESPNPFEITMDVSFISPIGRRYRVPGFYDGDGSGQMDGNQWKARFSADELGRWTFETDSDHPKLDGKTGSFVVREVSSNAQGLWKWGRLEYHGTADNRIRYLKFRDGPYWLKAGCDDPENCWSGGAKCLNTCSRAVSSCI